MSLVIEPIECLRKGTIAREARKQLPKPQDPRTTDIIARYRDGQTLVEIGFYYGVTRERIRQILKKHGVTGCDGGQAVRSLLSCAERKRKRAERAEHSERECRRRYGCSRQFLADISPYMLSDSRHPVFIFRHFMNNVRRVGIRSDLKFVDWWRIWQESGHWEERGRGYGFWMARWDSFKGFTKDNVRIVRGAERASDSYILKPVSMRQEKLRRTLVMKAQVTP